MDSSAGLFSSALPEPNPGTQTWLDGALRNEMPRIAAQVQTRDDYVAELCPMADIGEFIIRALKILSRIAEHFVRGSFVIDHVKSRATDLVDVDDGTSATYLNDKLEALKYDLGQPYVTLKH